MNKTNDLKEEKDLKIKKWRKKLPVLFIFLILIYLFTYFRFAFYPLLFGYFFGYILQRSRFCFASGFRDIFLIKNTTLARAVLLVLALTVIGFTLVGWVSGEGYLETAGRVYPLGVHTLFGGLLFGFGMVIAGACFSGCLVRVGEGYIMQIYTFSGLMVGSLLGAWHYGWWQEVSILKSPAIFLPNILGWPLAFSLQLLFIGCLYLLLIRYEKGKWPVLKMPVLAKPAGFNNKSWTYTTGALLLALNNTLMFYFWDRPWVLSAGVAHFSAWVVSKIGIDASDWVYFAQESVLECIGCFWQHPIIYLALAMVLGSLTATFLNNEFRWRKPRNIRYIFSGLAGGILMGYSARVAMGCNIGGFLGGVASFSLHAWFFGLFILIGAYFGGRFLLKFLL